MTCFHSVGIVAKYSYIVIVKAIGISYLFVRAERKKKAYNKSYYVLPYIKTGHIEYHSEIGREV